LFNDCFLIWIFEYKETKEEGEREGGKGG